MAALPVSPEVAVRMTTSPFMPSALAAATMRRGRTLRATSLKAEVGPRYSSSTYLSATGVKGVRSDVGNLPA